MQIFLIAHMIPYLRLTIIFYTCTSKHENIFITFILASKLLGAHAIFVKKFKSKFFYPKSSHVGTELRGEGGQPHPPILKKKKKLGKQKNL